MAVRSWNYHGTIQYYVDAEADLSSIPNPKLGEVALALAEGSLWFHTGTIWQEIAGGGGGGGTPLDVGNNTAYYTRFANGVNINGKYKLTGATFTETSTIDASSTFWIFDWQANNILRQYDVSSWIRGTTYASTYWGATLPANTQFEVPLGWYRWYFSYRSLADPIPDGTIEAYLDYGESPGVLGFDTEFNIFPDGNPVVDDVDFDPRFHIRSGTLLVPVSGIKVVPALSVHTNSHNSAGLDFIAFMITRVAEGT